MLHKFCEDILREISYFLDNKSKVRLYQTSRRAIGDGSFLILCYIKTINEIEGKLLTDKILKSNIFTKIEILNVRSNPKIKSINHLKDSLIQLDISYHCSVDQEGFQDCNKIQILNANYNSKVTSTNHLRDSLIQLDISGICGVDQKGFEDCNKIQILNARNNTKVTFSQK